MNAPIYFPIIIVSRAQPWIAKCEEGTEDPALTGRPNHTQAYEKLSMLGGVVSQIGLIGSNPNVRC